MLCNMILTLISSMLKLLQFKDLKWMSSHHNISPYLTQQRNSTWELKKINVLQANNKLLSKLSRKLMPGLKKVTTLIDILLKHHN